METLLKANAFVKNNLLLNTDFRSGIINQKGADVYQNLYTSGILSIDGCILENKLKMEVGNGFIVLSQDSSIPFTGRARFKLKKLANSGRYTITYNILENTCTTNTVITNGGIIKAKQTGVIPQTVNIYNNFSEIVFYVPVGGSLKIGFMKAEEGNFYSGMPLWDKLDELFYCWRMYHELYRIPIYATNANGLTYFVTSNFILPMKKTPSFKVTEVLNNSAVIQNVTVKSIAISDRGILNITFDKTIGQYGYITIFLDAYDY